jgi:hypothetical protein
MLYRKIARNAGRKIQTPLGKSDWFVLFWPIGFMALGSTFI